AVVGERIFQLTWENELGFVYDRASFEPLGTFTYAGEGWGLAHLDGELVMSDGTPTLRFLDPGGCAERRRLTVTANGRPLPQLNALAVVGPELFANVWMTDFIARIDPESGHVVGWIDLRGLLRPWERVRADVLNGIAWDATGRRLFVTGKYWPRLFEIRLVPRAAE
ncbi:MAG: glutaminyl-peptide cyclotransferase, partial [Myxococcales bacterium]